MWWYYFHLGGIRGGQCARSHTWLCIFTTDRELQGRVPPLYMEGKTIRVSQPLAGTSGKDLRVSHRRLGTLAFCQESAQQ